MEEMMEEGNVCVCAHVRGVCACVCVCVCVCEKSERERERECKD